MEDSFFPVTIVLVILTLSLKNCVAIQQVFLLLNIDNNNKETKKTKNKNSNIVN